jgi:hypothetical protein
LVYWFSYIYEINKKNILPIFVCKDDKQYTWTCFKSVCGIITAKHCIENFDRVCISGIDNKILTKENLDLVCIQLEDYDWQNCLMIDEDIRVLDDIMVMWYPTHWWFDNFVTATIGSVSAIEESYLYKHNLMLLTSKIKWWNSWWPVINKSGRFVWIITEVQANEWEQYDKFGYWVAIPSEYIKKIVEEWVEYNKKINFVDNI